MKRIVGNTMVFLSFLVFGHLLGGCKDTSQPGSGAQMPVEVDVLTVAPQGLDMVTELPGRTAAFRIAEVRPQVGGIIQKRLFTEGSEVQAGQLLYQIDPATYQAGFDSAKAALAKAEAQEHSNRLKAERYRVLVRTKAVSEQEQVEIEANWRQSVADVAAAKAALATARINLEYTRVTAPIGGRIGKSTVTEGALVTAQQANALATIQQLDPLYVDVSQSSSELLKLKKEIEAGITAQSDNGASDVRVLLEDGSEYAQPGTLEFSDVTVNPTTGTVTIRAIVPNSKLELLPGMFVRARISKGYRPEAILVPSVSLSRNSKGQSYVMVVNDKGEVDVRIVETGQNVGPQVLITRGLVIGERIVVAGLQKIRSGVPVKAVEQAKNTVAERSPAANDSLGKTE
ncbi:MAG: efflux RND transporter periplasmic adaptor subunit [Desulfobulbus oligotrophicus]|jgi:membrane fusion protein (multidrug efflux system)|nr:efflux RND transporter periplasmic adaptor subunit [Desulfobulbus oligotrophicus]